MSMTTFAVTRGMNRTLAAVSLVLAFGQGASGQVKPPVQRSQHIDMAQGECMRRAEFGLQANKIAENLNIGPDYVTGYRGLYFATIMCFPAKVIAGQKYPGAVNILLGGPHRDDADEDFENKMADTLMAYILSPGY